MLVVEKVQAIVRTSGEQCPCAASNEVPSYLYASRFRASEFPNSGTPLIATPTGPITGLALDLVWARSVYTPI